MVGEKRNKLNTLLREWPDGTVATLPWLRKRGIYQQLAYEYEKSGWLKRIGAGAYIRAGDQVSWLGAVHTIQSQLKLPIHIGGKSAMELKGFQHFIAMREGSDLYLFTSSRRQLPSWFTNYQWERRISFHVANLFKGRRTTGLVSQEIDHFLIESSSPERAMLEVLHLVPKDQGFEEARLIMEGLTGLRPKLVQSLLEKCRSIKAKRLFLHLAERCHHPWVEAININKIDLGKGKRVIVPGGRFDSKYGITVERERLADEGTQE